MFTETHIIIPHICFQISQLQQEVELQARKLRNAEDEHRQAIEDLRQREERLIKQVRNVNYCTDMGSSGMSELLFTLVLSIAFGCITPVIIKRNFFKKRMKIAWISGNAYFINCILEL